MALERGKLTDVVRAGAGATVGIVTVVSNKKIYIKSIIAHQPGGTVATGTAQVYFVPNGGPTDHTTKIFDADVNAGETVMMEPSYPLVLSATGDKLFVGTGNVTGTAATHMNFIVTGDQES
jgi:hypothetical protein